MKREIHRLSERRFDVLVIGGGIYGAWTALDCAQRGLSVALIEQHDFSGGTSANSQRVVHGGFRYLQHADFKRMRESIRERSILLRAAPHLIRPMPCYVPTMRHGVQRKSLVRMALLANDLISWDRNRGLSEASLIPPGRVVSRQELVALAPGFSGRDGVSGGAVFYDGQVLHAERLCLGILESAARAGAVLANYAQAQQLIARNGAVHHVVASDRIGDEQIEIKARRVVCCAGPWSGQMLSRLDPAITGVHDRSPFNLLRATVLVTRPIMENVSVAIPGLEQHQDDHEVLEKGFRNYFLTPWRDRTLLGTFHSPWDRPAGELSVSAEEIRRYVNRFNQDYPAAKLTYEDVSFTNIGLLPMAKGAKKDAPLPCKGYTILDHQRAGGTKGLFTVVGVKWTTARDVAEKTTNLLGASLGVRLPDAQTADLRLACAAGNGRFSRLESLFGTAAPALSGRIEQDPGLGQPILPGSEYTLAEVDHVIEREMAVRLEDLVFRRLGIADRGWPGEPLLLACAERMGRRLGWDEGETQTQLQGVRDEYVKHGVIHG